jgi:hypothetical protein
MGAMGSNARGADADGLSINVRPLVSVSSCGRSVSGRGAGVLHAMLPAAMLPTGLWSDQLSAGQLGAAGACASARAADTLESLRLRVIRSGQYFAAVMRFVPSTQIIQAVRQRPLRDQ